MRVQTPKKMKRKRRRTDMPTLVSRLAALLKTATLWRVDIPFIVLPSLSCPASGFSVSTGSPARRGKLDPFYLIKARVTTKQDLIRGSAELGSPHKNQSQRDFGSTRTNLLSLA